MHHKRGRARNARAGCKLCKPWKVNGYRTERREGEKFGDYRRRTVAAAQARDRLRATAPDACGSTSHTSSG